MTLAEAICRLEAAGVASPTHDARELFRRFGGLPEYELALRSASSQSAELAEALRRRENGEPLQYIVSEVGFYRELYEVTPACLIPRQDTEVLVDYAVKAIPEGESFEDICTGSGCIAISVLANTRGTRALALDISEEALAVAKRNAARNRVAERISFVCGDATTHRPTSEVFAVLSNPPYVTEEEYARLDRELFREPRLALVGGADGLDFYRALVPNCKGRLKRGGFIAFEIGAAQGAALEEIAKENSMTCELIKDLGGKDRVAVLREKQ